MRPDVARSMTRSAATFRDLVWPAIAGACGGGSLVSVEEVTATGFAKDLDALAGIDHWQVIADTGMRGIASRVQRDSMRPYRRGPLDTFTIRCSLARGGPTELHKRWQAIQGRYVYPHLWAHAYVADAHDVLTSVAVVETRTLIERAGEWWMRHHDGTDLWRERDGMWVKDVTGGNRMLVIPWDLIGDALITRWAVQAAA